MQACNYFSHYTRLCITTCSSKSSSPALKPSTTYNATQSYACYAASSHSAHLSCSEHGGSNFPISRLALYTYNSMQPPLFILPPIFISFFSFSVSLPAIYLSIFTPLISLFAHYFFPMFFPLAAPFRPTPSNNPASRTSSQKTPFLSTSRSGLSNSFTLPASNTIILSESKIVLILCAMVITVLWLNSWDLRVC